MSGLDPEAIVDAFPLALPISRRERVAACLRSEVQLLRGQLSQSLKICDVLERLNCQLNRFIDQLIADGYHPTDAELAHRIEKIKVDRETLLSDEISGTLVDAANVSTESFPSLSEEAGEVTMTPVESCNGDLSNEEQKDQNDVNLNQSLQDSQTSMDTTGGLQNSTLTSQDGSTTNIFWMPINIYTSGQTVPTAPAATPSDSVPNLAAIAPALAGLPANITSMLSKLTNIPKNAPKSPSTPVPSMPTLNAKPSSSGLKTTQSSGQTTPPPLARIQTVLGADLIPAKLAANKSAANLATINKSAATLASMPYAVAKAALDMEADDLNTLAPIPLDGDKTKSSAASSSLATNGTESYMPFYQKQRQALINKLRIKPFNMRKSSFQHYQPLMNLYRKLPKVCYECPYCHRKFVKGIKEKVKEHLGQAKSHTALRCTDPQARKDFDEAKLRQPWPISRDQWIEGYLEQKEKRKQKNLALIQKRLLRDNKFVVPE